MVHRSGTRWPFQHYFDECLPHTSSTTRTDQQGRIAVFERLYLICRAHQLPQQTFYYLSMTFSPRSLAMFYDVPLNYPAFISSSESASDPAAASSWGKTCIPFSTASLYWFQSRQHQSRRFPQGKHSPFPDRSGIFHTRFGRLILPKNRAPTPDCADQLWREILNFESEKTHPKVHTFFLELSCRATSPANSRTSRRWRRSRESILVNNKFVISKSATERVPFERGPGRTHISQVMWKNVESFSFRLHV